MYKVLWHIQTPIPGRCCIWCWPWSWNTKGMYCGKHKVPDNVILCPMAFASKRLSSAEWQCNIKQKVLCILHGFKKFHHYWLAKEVCVITDDKPLMVWVNKDVATLFQQLQCIMLHIHQYGVHILYKLGPELYIVDWLSPKNM